MPTTAVITELRNLFEGAFDFETAIDMVYPGADINSVHALADLWSRWEDLDTADEDDE
jgi:hypothetical protein